MRRYIFEFEDLSWFPDTIRRSMVDYLSFFLRKTNFYQPISPLIAECLEHSADKQIIDLCSGGGGPIPQIHTNLRKETGSSIPFVLTDKYPNTDAYEYMRRRYGNSISYCDTPVDATEVDAGLKGVRTMFSAFHHFDNAAAKAVLADAVANGAPIAIFDGGDKNIITILGIILLHPLIFFFCTPFFRPFRFSRLVFTYLIPLIPFCTVWDGLMSILRLYTKADMEKLLAEMDNATYHWQTGRKKHPLGFHVAYLIGYPKV